jgi:hypothetical protein
MRWLGSLKRIILLVHLIQAVGTNLFEYPFWVGTDLIVPNVGMARMARSIGVTLAV